MNITRKLPISILLISQLSASCKLTKNNKNIDKTTEELNQNSSYIEIQNISNNLQQSITYANQQISNFTSQLEELINSVNSAIANTQSHLNTNYIINTPQIPKNSVYENTTINDSHNISNNYSTSGSTENSQVDIDEKSDTYSTDTTLDKSPKSIDNSNNEDQQDDNNFSTDTNLNKSPKSIDSSINDDQQDDNNFSTDINYSLSRDSDPIQIINWSIYNNENDKTKNITYNKIEHEAIEIKEDENTKFYKSEIEGNFSNLREIHKNISISPKHSIYKENDPNFYFTNMKNQINILMINAYKKELDFEKENSSKSHSHPDINFHDVASIVSKYVLQLYVMDFLKYQIYINGYEKYYDKYLKFLTIFLFRHGNLSNKLKVGIINEIPFKNEWDLIFYKEYCYARMDIPKLFDPNTVEYTKYILLQLAKKYDNDYIFKDIDKFKVESGDTNQPNNNEAITSQKEEKEEEKEDHPNEDKIKNLNNMFQTWSRPNSESAIYLLDFISNHNIDINLIYTEKSKINDLENIDTSSLANPSHTYNIDKEYKEIFKKIHDFTSKKLPNFFPEKFCQELVDEQFNYVTIEVIKYLDGVIKQLEDIYSKESSIFNKINRISSIINNIYNIPSIYHEVNSICNTDFIEKPAVSSNILDQIEKYKKILDSYNKAKKRKYTNSVKEFYTNKNQANQYITETLDIYNKILKDINSIDLKLLKSYRNPHQYTQELSIEPSIDFTNKSNNVVDVISKYLHFNQDIITIFYELKPINILNNAFEKKLVSEINTLIPSINYLIKLPQKISEQNYSHFDKKLAFFKEKLFKEIEKLIKFEKLSQEIDNSNDTMLILAKNVFITKMYQDNIKQTINNIKNKYFPIKNKQIVKTKNTAINISNNIPSPPRVVQLTDNSLLYDNRGLSKNQIDQYNARYNTELIHYPGITAKIIKETIIHELKRENPGIYISSLSDLDHILLLLQVIKLHKKQGERIPADITRIKKSELEKYIHYFQQKPVIQLSTNTSNNNIGTPYYNRLESHLNLIEKNCNKLKNNGICGDEVDIVINKLKLLKDFSDKLENIKLVELFQYIYRFYTLQTCNDINDVDTQTVKENIDKEIENILFATELCDEKKANKKIKNLGLSIDGFFNKLNPSKTKKISSKKIMPKRSIFIKLNTPAFRNVDIAKNKFYEDNRSIQNLIDNYNLVENKINEYLDNNQSKKSIYDKIINYRNMRISQQANREIQRLLNTALEPDTGKGTKEINKEFRSRCRAATNLIEGIKNEVFDDKFLEQFEDNKNNEDDGFIS